MARQLSGLVAQSARRGRERGERETNDEVEPVTFMPGYEINDAISMCEVSAAESRFASVADPFVLLAKPQGDEVGRLTRTKQEAVLVGGGWGGLPTWLVGLVGLVEGW
jgi:hypothetical protein